MKTPASGQRVDKEIGERERNGWTRAAWPPSPSRWLYPGLAGRALLSRPAARQDGTTGPGSVAGTPRGHGREDGGSGTPFWDELQSRLLSVVSPVVLLRFRLWDVVLDLTNC